MQVTDGTEASSVATGVEADERVAAERREETPVGAGLVGWRAALHGLIIVALASEVLYATFQVFVVLQPAGHIGPLGAFAGEVPYELLMARRMYAIEGWVAFGALALYLGITEIRPYLKRDRRRTR